MAEARKVQATKEELAAASAAANEALLHAAERFLQAGDGEFAVAEAEYTTAEAVVEACRRVKRRQLRRLFLHCSPLPAFSCNNRKGGFSLWRNAIKYRYSAAGASLAAYRVTCWRCCRKARRLMASI